MAVTITTIQPTDSIASSRLTLNSNFSALQSGINSVQLLLDPVASVLSGVKSATISNLAVSYSVSVFSVGQGSALQGNLITGTIGASTSVLMNGNGGVTIDQSTLTLNSGNLVLSNSSSLLTVGGDISVSQEFRLPGIAAAFAAIVGMTANTTINVANLKYLIIKNNSTTVGLTATIGAGNLGQVLRISHALGASGKGAFINASNFSGLTGSIAMYKSGDSINAIYDGTAWYLTSYSAASYAAGGATSSVTFTTTY